MARHSRKLDPALLIEAAYRQEIMGQKGVFFGHRIVGSSELRQLAGTPVFPLSPFVAPVSKLKTDY